MHNPSGKDHSHIAQLRLLLEELCSDLCRFSQVSDHNLRPEDICIEREYYLGKPGAYCDIYVKPKDLAPYVVEIKFGYSPDILLNHLRRKYRETCQALNGATKLILVIDSEKHKDWESLLVEIVKAIDPQLTLEVWSERQLIQHLQNYFRVHIDAITPENLMEVRQAIDYAKGYYAIGATSFSEYEHTPLNSELLWHFGFWKLQQLRQAKHLNVRDIFPPGHYRGVAVLVADLCSFSSYVRDTPDSSIIRECLTSFYSKARYQIINHGGMFYQFVGDEAIGLFGIPERSDESAHGALQCAQSLISIGNSVSQHWQRQIDRVQSTGGLHIGLAVGDLQIVSLRPFSRTHIGAIGDCINVAARLMSAAGPSEIVASNTFIQSLDVGARSRFEELEPIEAKSVGSIKAWKLSQPQK